MSDKAERVAEQFPDIMLKWYATPGVAMQDEWKRRATQEISAILREEYPDEPTLDQLAKSQGVEPIEDMGTLVIPGLEDDPPIDPAPDVSEAEKALCMDILGERGRSVDEVNRLATLLIAYREGLKAQTAPDVSALREAAEIGRDYVAADLADHDEKYRRHPATETYRETIAQDLARIDSALLRSEPKLGGTV